MASSQEAATSLGSHTRSAIQLSGKAPTRIGSWQNERRTKRAGVSPDADTTSNAFVRRYALACLQNGGWVSRLTSV